MEFHIKKIQDCYDIVSNVPVFGMKIFEALKIFFIGTTPGPGICWTPPPLRPLWKIRRGHPPCCYWSCRMSEIKQSLDECETKEDLEVFCKWLYAKETEIRIKNNELDYENKRGLLTRIDVAKAEYERIAVMLVHSLENFPDRIRELCDGVTPEIYNAMRSELERILDGHRDAALNLSPEPTTVVREKERTKKASQREKKKTKV